MSGVNPASPFENLENLSFDAVCAARRGAGLVAVFDFDGTLVKIARDPESVRATPKVGQGIETLARRADTTVGVVSGRPLDHLLHMVDAPDVWLFGLHGWEHRAPGGPVVRGWPPSALDVGIEQRALLRRRLGPSQGERIEDKGPIVALHCPFTVASVATVGTGAIVSSTTTVWVWVVGFPFPSSYVQVTVYVPCVV